MLVKKFILPTLLASSFTWAVSPTSKEIEALQKQLELQAKQIEYLQQKLERMETERDRLTAYQQTKEESPIIYLRPGIEGLQIKADLRLRYEKRSGNDANYNRFQTRFRLGFKWLNPEKNFEIGAGFITGSENPSTSNNTHSNEYPFQSGDLRLDYAYARHFWDDFSVTVGQAPNPYLTSAILWDPSVRPVGVTVNWRGTEVQKGKQEGFYAIAGIYDFAYAPDNDTDNESFITAMQLGWAPIANKDNSLLFTTSAYLYDSAASEANTFVNNNGDRVVPNQDFDYTFSLVDIYVKGRHKFSDELSASLYTHGVMNVGAGSGDQSVLGGNEQADDHNIAYLLGSQIDLDNFYLKTEYRYIEADSVNSWFQDPVFGSGTGVGVNAKNNVEGLHMTLGYKISSNMNVYFVWMHYKEIEEQPDSESIDLYQLNLLYSF
ncbi:MAG: putative porin [Lentisphaeria bacterium]|nr:putative porin [Lentisphaeria bacterium]